MSEQQPLLELFAIVFGDPPRSRPIAPVYLDKAEQRLRSLSETYSPDLAVVRIPDELVTLHALFGGEKELLTKYYHFYTLDTLVPALSHVVFALDPRSGMSFGLNHYLLRYDDPPVEIAATRDRDDTFSWAKHCDNLSACLVQFVARNLLEMLKFHLFVVDTSPSTFRVELADYRTIPLPQDDDHGVIWQPYYAPGTIILVNPVENSAMIGFDTLEQALAFQFKHNWDFEETFPDD